MLRATRTIVERIGQRAAAHRRELRPGLRRRLRPGVPQDVLGQGRRDQPRGARDGQGAAPGQVLATTAVLERVGHQVRRGTARTVHGQGQVASRSSAASVGPTAQRARARRRRPRRSSGREAELARARRGARRRRCPAGGGSSTSSASRGSGSRGWCTRLLARTDARTVVAPCDEYEAATAYWPFRSCCAELAGGDAGGRRRGLWSTPCALVADQREPALLALAAAGGRACSTSTCLRRPEVDALAERFRKARGSRR